MWFWFIGIIVGVLGFFVESGRGFRVLFYSFMDGSRVVGGFGWGGFGWEG